MTAISGAPPARKRAARSSRTAPAASPRVGSILIRPEPFGCGFDVVTPRASADREFPDIASARAYADEIAARLGLLIEERSW